MTKSSSSVSNSDTPLFSTLKDDFRVIRHDVQQRGIKRAVGGTLTTVEAFYLTEEDRKRLAEMPTIGRWAHRTWWLLKSLLLKLTPARRVILAFALFFLLLGSMQIRVRAENFSFRVPWLGILSLLTLLMLELKDKLVARDELEAGRQVQLALMPKQMPDIPGWDVWLYTQPANDVGGDLVDHLQLDETRHIVALGDVAGKALPAALLSVKLQATLRALAPRFTDLGELGNDLNRILHRDGLPTRFASLVYLEVTPNCGAVRVLNAGHMPPLVVRGETIVSLDRGSMVLGIMPDARFFEQSVELNPGETLVVYSDGVSEAMNEANDFFGDERLYAAIQRAPGADAKTTGTAILDAVARFVGDAVPNDDVSLMVLRRTQ